MNYGNKLFQLRDRLGLTNVEMGKLLNISDSLYSRYEKNKQTIPIRHLNKLCNYFKVSIDYVFGFTGLSVYKNTKDNINYTLQHSRLKELRKKYNLTQKKFADSINVSKSAIGDYEVKDKPIATPFLYDICKKYNKSADYLLGKIDHPKYLK